MTGELGATLGLNATTLCRFILSGRQKMLKEMMGPKPRSDAFMCHRCDNGLCVNRDHLFWGTHADNMMDMRLKKRDRASYRKLVAEVRRSEHRDPWSLQELHKELQSRVRRKVRDAKKELNAVHLLLCLMEK